MKGVKKASVILLKFVFLIFGCVSIQSQTETSECADFTSLTEIDLEEIKPSTEKYLEIIKSKTERITTLYCPPNHLFF